MHPIEVIAYGVMTFIVLSCIVYVIGRQCGHFLSPEEHARAQRWHEADMAAAHESRHAHEKRMAEHRAKCPYCTEASQ